MILEVFSRLNGSVIPWVVVFPCPLEEGSEQCQVCGVVVVLA